MQTRGENVFGRNRKKRDSYGIVFIFSRLAASVESIGVRVLILFVLLLLVFVGAIATQLIEVHPGLRNIHLILRGLPFLAPRQPLVRSRVGEGASGGGRRWGGPLRRRPVLSVVGERCKRGGRAGEDGVCLRRNARGSVLRCL
ncbi:hypothetical protein BOTBODRAFT_596191 [Botryobasidium botryosum FD-172 SS1]|uniref:Uncharacterized protein n=1 Tax=Botryobasidium botryosum (strain FD-172 SS1) TaxID=930990 RepID=A0A067LZB0_BOTB1|nr:hypothetical protein BOTBODRAFT_596191 [Botryobasidium botryosum FD-172 SS1]